MPRGSTGCRRLHDTLASAPAGALGEPPTASFSRMTSQSTRGAFAFRLLGGLAGTVAGGFLGFLVVILVIIFSGESLGTTSVVLGVVVGGCIGFVLGVCCPRLMGGFLASLFSGV